MKKYKFKLDPLLKIRKLKEEQCKMEIGRCQVKIRELKEQIQAHDNSIDEAYESQEEALDKGIEGQAIQFYPYFVSGKTAHIKILEGEVEQIQKQVDRKFQELSRLRANVKVIEKMKHKDRVNYKRELNKKLESDLEESNQNWQQFLKES